jgi:pyrimidine-specific ribonucleoside hydrolase
MSELNASLTPNASGVQVFATGKSVMHGQRIPVILDGDPGHDDAIAWMLAKSSPLLDIRAVTSAAGNQTLEKTTYNARRICTLLGIDAPVAMGRPRPLLADPITAGNIHGQTGLDGPALPEPAMELSPLSAVELMAKVLRESETPVTIIATGPETNVAALLLAHPELKSKIAKISVMGGGIAYGNWTPAAEFNILVDPEAADIVFSSGILVEMAGLDVTEKALVFPEDFERIRAVGNQVAQVVADWLEFFYKFHRSIGYAGAPVHDPCAVAALLKPELFTMRDLYVAIETTGEYCRGTTVGDLNASTGHTPNARCLLGVDHEGFVDLLVDAVKTYDGWEVRV